MYLLFIIAPLLIVIIIFKLVLFKLMFYNQKMLAIKKMEPSQKGYKFSHMDPISSL